MLHEEAIGSKWRVAPGGPLVTGMGQGQHLQDRVFGFPGSLWPTLRLLEREKGPLGKGVGELTMYQISLCVRRFTRTGPLGGGGGNQGMRRRGRGGQEGQRVSPRPQGLTDQVLTLRAGPSLVPGGQ